MSRVRLVAAVLALASASCEGERAPAEAPAGAITGVSVILTDSREPLPFDPRGGRITVVTREIASLVGHPIVLELDTALSPELKASLEESVLASFETVVRELVFLKKEDPILFSKAASLERVVCKYDAVVKDGVGVLSESGRELRVTSPPDRFPLLERGLLVDAVVRAHVTELDARWGEVRPAQLSAGEQEPYFTYLMSTRPGAGYLWIAARARSGRDWDTLREEHLRRLLELARAVDARDAASPLARKVRHVLAESVTYASSRPGLHAEYATWLGRSVTRLEEADRLTLARALFERRGEVSLPGFDRFAWGLSLYDEWSAGKLAAGGELEKLIVCPSKRRGEAETEIKWSCSAFFATVFEGEPERQRLREVVLARPEKDALRLQELALMNVGHDMGKRAVAYVESVASRRALFVDGVRVLFHDDARRDDVRSALDEAAARWWRDYPNERGLWLLVMARRWESLHVHYADSQWGRFQKEFGGPVKKDVLAAFVAEGPRAVEMIPKMWLAFAKGPERDEEVARGLGSLLERDRADRTSRATATLALLRVRLCAEKNGTGLAVVRGAVEAWATKHPEARAGVSNALADFTLARCPRAPNAEGDP